MPYPKQNKTKRRNLLKATAKNMRKEKWIYIAKDFGKLIKIVSDPKISYTTVKWNKLYFSLAIFPNLYARDFKFVC